MKNGGDRSRDDRKDGTDRARPDQPANWREMMRAGYDYPDEIDELSRRQRRRAKRTWRRDDHAQRVVWLRQQRQAEPTSPVTVVVAVLILAIVVLGLGGGLPRLFRSNEPKSGDVGVLAPSHPPDNVPTSSTSTAAPSGPSTLQNSTPPILTERPSAAAATIATTAINAWARVFYTRDPAAETYVDLLDKTAPYITTELGDNLQAEGDTTYDALKSDGGKSTVASVKIETPRPDSAPVDTPSRISRLVSITIDVTGKQANRIVLPLLITLVPEGSGWVISDLNGGSGP